MYIYIYIYQYVYIYISICIYIYINMYVYIYIYSYINGIIMIYHWYIIGIIINGRYGWNIHWPTFGGALIDDRLEGTWISMDWLKGSIYIEKPSILHGKIHGFRLSFSLGPNVVDNHDNGYNVGKTMPFLPPMTGNGTHTTYIYIVKMGDDLFVFYSHLFYMPWSHI